MKVRPRDWSEGYAMTSKVPVLDFDEKSRKDSSALFVYGKSSFTLNFRDERAHTQRQKSDNTIEQFRLNTNDVANVVLS